MYYYESCKRIGKISKSEGDIMEKKYFFAILILVITSSVLIISGCLTNQETNSISDIKIEPSTIQKIEVFHFHGTQQCYSCKTVGEYADETLNTYFAEELKSGKIVFKHINYDLPENSAVVAEYGATGSSLWLGVYAENGFHKEENVNVWYKINAKQDYMSYFKGLMEKRLTGDFS
jgi:hypothetical protein